MTKSKKTSKTRQKTDFGMEPKNNNTSFHMLVDHRYAFGLLLHVAFRSKEEVRWRGPSVTYFCPTLDPPLDGSGRKTIILVRDHEHFIPTKFHKYPSIGSVGEADYVFPYIYMH